MDRMLREARITHTFGGEESSGWVAPHEATAPRGAPRTVPLLVTIEQTHEGFVLSWEGPEEAYSGDHTYPELKYAEHAAEELFGITSDAWDGAA